MAHFLHILPVDFLSLVFADFLRSDTFSTPFINSSPFFLFLERDREREQPGGVHLSDAADPPHPDLQVMPKFFSLAFRVTDPFL
jgi:hypothetical protein